MPKYIIKTSLECSSSLIDGYIYKVQGKAQPLSRTGNKTLEGETVVNTTDSQITVSWILSTSPSAKVNGTSTVTKNGAEEPYRKKTYEEATASSQGYAKRSHIFDL